MKPIHWMLRHRILTQTVQGDVSMKTGHFLFITGLAATAAGLVLYYLTPAIADAAAQVRSGLGGF